MEATSVIDNKKEPPLPLARKEMTWTVPPSLLARQTDVVVLPLADASSLHHHHRRLHGLSGCSSIPEIAFVLGLDFRAQENSAVVYILKDIVIFFLNIFFINIFFF